MCDNTVVFPHIYNKTICSACLSSDRTLFTLDQNTDIFRKICDLKRSVIISNFKLCWECTAVLNKILLFKAKVKQAQRTLETQFKHPPKSLSKLTTVINEDKAIFLIGEKDEIKLSEIKQEFNTNEDKFTDNYQDFENDTHEEEIKKELTETKCDNATQRIKNNSKRLIYKNYQLIYSVPKQKLRKKVTIKISDVKLWMKKEKNNPFYKSFKYKCGQCVYGWNCKEKWREHNQKYHDMTLTPYICDICACRFTTKSSLRTHMNNHIITQECTQCGYKCYSWHVMSEHLRKHRNVIRCLYCEETSKNMSAFYKHFKSMHGVFSCDHCGKKCKSKHMLQRHISRHFETYECKICNKRYKSADALRRHTDCKHVTVRSEAAYCVQCDRQFDNTTIFKQHVLTSAAHAQERNARKDKKTPCPVCGNMYSCKYYMMNHYRHVHMKQSKYYCDQCDRHFLNNTRYMYHRRYYHEGVKKEKNKICNICGRGFAVNRTLIHHIRTHSGERPHACAHCDARFAQPYALRAHERRLHAPGGAHQRT